MGLPYKRWSYSAGTAHALITRATRHRQASRADSIDAGHIRRRRHVRRHFVTATRRQKCQTEKYPPHAMTCDWLSMSSDQLITLLGNPVTNTRQSLPDTPPDTDTAAPYPLLRMSLEFSLSTGGIPASLAQNSVASPFAHSDSLVNADQ